MPPSPALQIIGKMKPTLQGRCVGILVDDGSDAAAIAALRKAAEKAAGAVSVACYEDEVGDVSRMTREALAADGVNARVISAPSLEWFEEQTAEYRESVLPAAVKARVSVEAGLALGEPPTFRSRGWRDGESDLASHPHYASAGHCARGL